MIFILLRSLNAPGEEAGRWEVLWAAEEEAAKPPRSQMLDLRRDAAAPSAAAAPCAAL